MLNTYNYQSEITGPKLMWFTLSFPENGLFSHNPLQHFMHFPNGGALWIGAFGTFIDKKTCSRRNQTRNCKIQKATRHQQKCPDPPDVHLSCSHPGHFRPPELQRQLLANVLPTIILCTIGKKRSSKLPIILYKQCFDYGDSEVTLVRFSN